MWHQHQFCAVLSNVDRDGRCSEVVGTGATISDEGRGLLGSVRVWPCGRVFFHLQSGPFDSMGGILTRAALGSSFGTDLRVSKGEWKHVVHCRSPCAGAAPCFVGERFGRECDEIACSCTCGFYVHGWVP